MINNAVINLSLILGKPNDLSCYAHSFHSFVLVWYFISLFVFISPNGKTKVMIKWNIKWTNKLWKDNLGAIHFPRNYFAVTKRQTNTCHAKITFYTFWGQMKHWMKWYYSRLFELWLMPAILLAKQSQFSKCGIKRNAIQLINSQND